jgi:hypothetical protein
MNPRYFPLEEPPMPTQKVRLARIARFAAGWTLLVLAALPATLQAQGQQTSGPDVTVIYIGDTTNYGASGGIRGYAIGTTSCNIGTTPVNWCDNGGGCTGLTSAQHPVIAQNMFRLLDGRFEQIGMSWLKHGFVSTNSDDPSCIFGQSTCDDPPRGGNELGVGCTDTYGSSLNGSRPMGMRSEVNPTTGVFPFPETQVTPTLVYDQRIKVAESDLALAGASYWVEAQYISDNDAVFGNGFNNASYRPVTVNATSFSLSFDGSTIREKTAIQAWKTADPAVETFDEDFCSAPKERFEVARKVTEVDGDTWHYEYVVRNLNSDHAAGAFSVDFPDGTPIANVGFKDIDQHSGEPYATTDWTPEVDATNGTVRWFTEDYTANQNANALRWATMFNFWFDADAAPETAVHAVELFKPVVPTIVIVDAGPGASICAGDTAHLGTAAVPGQTYLWAPGGATTAEIDVSPAITTVYTLTAMNACSSAEDTVTVTVDIAPTAPLLLLPADGATGLQTTVELSWNSSAGASDYTVELATNALFTQNLQSQTVATTQATFAGLGPVQHFWRVTANGTCTGSPSLVFDFTVTNELFIDGFASEDTSAWSLTIP